MWRPSTKTGFVVGIFVIIASGIFPELLEKMPEWIGIALLVIIGIIALWSYAIDRPEKNYAFELKKTLGTTKW